MERTKHFHSDSSGCAYMATMGIKFLLTALMFTRVAVAMRNTTEVIPKRIGMSQLAFDFALTMAKEHSMCSFVLFNFDKESVSRFMHHTEVTILPWPLPNRTLENDLSVCRVVIYHMDGTDIPSQQLKILQQAFWSISNKMFFFLLDNDHKEDSSVYRMDLSNAYEQKMATSLMSMDFRSNVELAEVINTANLIMLHMWCPGQGLKYLVNVYHDSVYVKNHTHGSTMCESALKNKIFNVSAIGNQPFIVYTEEGEMKGSDVATLDIVAKKLGFEFDMVPEQMWGAPGPNGKWLGTVGAVYHGRSRVGIGHFNVDWFFTQVIEFSTTVYNLETRLIAPKPKSLPPFMNVVRPFALSVWLLSIGSFLAVVAAFSFLRYIKVVKMKNKKWDRENLAGPILDCYQMQLSQGSGFRFVQTHGGQFLLLIYLLYVTVILSAYECNLRAYLIAIDYEKPVDTLQDIVDLDRHLYLPMGTNFDSNFANSELETSKIIYKAIMEENLFHGSDAGLLPLDFEKELIANGDVILMSLDMKKASDPRIEARYGYQPYRVGDIVFPFVSGFVLTKNEPSNADINAVIKSLFESGIVNYLISSFISPKALIPFKEEERVEVPFTMSHIGTMVGWIICGLLVSCMVYGVEMYQLHYTANPTAK